MTFRQFAFNNVLRNKRLYAAYFLSSMFTVMVFFTFANFAFHPALTGEGMNAHVMKGMLVAGGIIYVFSFFYILYSMSSFLQSRKKEFGVLMIHGMSNQQIRWMVFLENMLIGVFATLFGIGLGLVFSKLILLIAENVLVLDENLHFYIPMMAVVITLCSFIILFFFISIFVTFILRTKKLVTLMKGEKIGKSEPKSSVWLTILSVLLLGCGYAIALNVNGAAVVIALIPVVLLVIIGTYILFTQVSVFLIRKLKNNEKLFWKKTNMLLLSDLSYRMRDNARAFFMVAIISTVAFSAIGTLVGFNSYLTKGVKTASPISFQHYGHDNEEFIETIEQTFADYQLITQKAEVELTYYEQNGEWRLITTPETYNAYADLVGAEEIMLRDDEVTVVEQSAANMMAPQSNLEDSFIILTNKTKIAVNKNLVGIAKPNVLPEIKHYYIVGEEIYNHLSNPVSTEKYVSWQVINGNQNDIIEAGRLLYDNVPRFTAIDFVLYDISIFWSPIMLVGLFIGIVFFVSAGSFLYFRLYMDLDEDKEKFTAINKIGLTTKEMKKVIGRQITILFFAPIVVALTHGAVALTALSNMFGYNLVYEATLVLVSFFIIQVVYYMIVRYFYTKQIQLAIK